MLFHIKHATRYRYSRPVFCDPMTIRLRPREDAAQRLLRYNLWIDPQPAGMSEYVDVDGHTATQVWFDQPMTTLSIVVSSTVQTLRENPFNYLLSPDATLIPLQYPGGLREALSAYLQQGEPEKDVVAAANVLMARCDGRLPQFLTELNQWLHDDFQRYVRLDGPPLAPPETLAARNGSCRDLAVLFIAICRSVGLAARFVSGYHEREGTDGKRHLHAWAEVYLPGAGWRGYDPVEGLAVADRHVALAAGAWPELAAPTFGTFRGNGAESSLETQLIIRASDSADPLEPPVSPHFNFSPTITDAAAR
jgi:transglutaminase-like putative cysteine protease